MNNRLLSQVNLLKKNIQMSNRHSSAGNTSRKNAKSGSDSGKSISSSIAFKSAPISCNFRYLGTYFLIIISDGCDQLRQQQWLQQWIISDGQKSSQQLPTSAAELNEFNQNWTNEFIANVVQQINNGK